MCVPVVLGKFLPFDITYTITAGRISGGSCFMTLTNRRGASRSTLLLPSNVVLHVIGQPILLLRVKCCGVGFCHKGSSSIFFFARCKMLHL